MRSNGLKLVIVFACIALAGISVTSRAQPPATEDATDNNGSTPASQQAPNAPAPATAQQKPPPKRPDSFKPTEEVRADTILTLPSDI